jgi:hypothetical protein
MKGVCLQYKGRDSPAVAKFQNLMVTQELKSVLDTGINRQRGGNEGIRYKMCLCKLAKFCSSRYWVFRIWTRV